MTITKLVKSSLRHYHYIINSGKRKIDPRSSLPSTPSEKKCAHLVDGGLLYEAWGVCRQQAVGGHDVDLIGPALLQDLCRRNEVFHVVYDVILWGAGRLKVLS